VFTQSLNQDQHCLVAEVFLLLLLPHVAEVVAVDAVAELQVSFKQKKYNSKLTDHLLIIIYLLSHINY